MGTNGSAVKPIGVRNEEKLMEKNQVSVDIWASGWLTAGNFIAGNLTWIPKIRVGVRYFLSNISLFVDICGVSQC